MSKCYIQIPTIIAVSFLEAVGRTKSDRLVLKPNFFHQRNQIHLMILRELYLILNGSRKVLRWGHCDNFFTRILAIAKRVLSEG
jgi:hypothetical protein